LPLAFPITRRDAVTVRPAMPGMMTCQGGAGEAGLMSDGLSGLVNRIIAWADRLQREHGVLGFPYAVVKKRSGIASGPVSSPGTSGCSRCWRR
jgi:hypothetical protein